jgi:protein-disulfide isomerase
MKKTHMGLGLGALVLALLIAAALGLFSGSSGSGAALNAQQQAALVRPHSPTLGSPGAKVVLVEFLDPACEACAAFYPHVKELLAQSNGQVRLVLRYAPFHKGSFEAALALEAARAQGRYWPILEKLMQSQNLWVVNHRVDIDKLWAVLEQSGLDVAKARADAQDPKLAAQVEQDMLDGNSLAIERTPSFFVNGQPLTDFGLKQLKDLVAAKTQEAYKS